MARRIAAQSAAREPDHARRNHQEAEAVPSEGDIVVHDGVRRPRQPAGALPDPVQAIEEEKNADDKQCGLHDTPREPVPKTSSRRIVQRLQGAADYSAVSSSPSSSLSVREKDGPDWAGCWPAG